MSKFTITDTSATGTQPGMIKAIVKYTDEAGRAREETLRWRYSLDELGNLGVEQLDKVTKSTMDYAKVEKELASSMKQVEDARASTVGRKQNVAEVQKVLDLSNQLETATKSAKLPGATQGDIQKVRDLGQSLSVAKSEMGNLGKDTLTFGNAFKIALERITQWGLATAVIYGSLRQLKEGIQYVKDLNKALTDVQVVSGQSAEKVSMLADSYNKLARELGATTLQIADSSLTWVRQGKTIEESFTLTRNAMVLSKLANIESAQSSEYLTSIMLGFKMEVGETVDAIDKLIAVDNASATSAAELAEAISRTANIAQMAGVSFSDLSAYIGTVSSVTRKSAIYNFGAL